MAEARKLRTRVVQHRRIVRDGESLKNQEHMARIRLAEKLQKLAVVPGGTRFCASAAEQELGPPLWTANVFYCRICRIGG